LDEHLTTPMTPIHSEQQRKIQPSASFTLLAMGRRRY
jgi:hypothetical protein